MDEEQKEKEQYYSSKYDTKGRFCSYWHQIDEIRRTEPDSVLDIGIGNGFVSNYLRNAGINIKTVDINEKLKPDYTASVLDMPFSDSSFGIVSCCEVLEHLPFKDFPKALREIHRVTRKNMVISLPDRSKAYPVSFTLPRIGVIKVIVPWWRIPPKFDPRRCSEHKWELGLRGYSLKKIIAIIEREEFEVKRTYRVFENPKHRFFVLEALNKG